MNLFMLFVIYGVTCVVFESSSLLHWSYNGSCNFEHFHLCP